MTEQEIDIFKKLNEEKSKMVQISHSVKDKIVNINNEIYALRENCDHLYADGQSAIVDFHPFHHCNICGENY